MDGQLCFTNADDFVPNLFQNASRDEATATSARTHQLTCRHPLRPEDFLLLDNIEGDFIGTDLKFRLGLHVKHAIVGVRQDQEGGRKAKGSVSWRTAPDSGGSREKTES